MFKEALQRHEPTIAFAIDNGHGRFLFLLFIPTDTNGNIKWNALELFIILSRTQAILHSDLKGQHFHQGDFKVQLTEHDVAAIRAELGLDDGAPHLGNAFDINRFLQDLNAAIPLTLPLEEKVAAMREQPDLIRTYCKKHIADALKIYLMIHPNFLWVTGLGKTVSGIAFSLWQAMPRSGLARKPRRGAGSRQSKPESASAWLEKLL